MSRDRLGPAGGPDDQIVDAEFVEIDEQGNGPSAGVRQLRPSRWSGLSATAKLIVVVVPLLLLAMCAIGLSSTPTSPADPAVSNSDGAALEQGADGVPSLSKEWLVGSWILVRKGGSDGQTACKDFRAPALVRRNPFGGKLISFGADDNYEGLFVAQHPSGAQPEHFTGTWSVTDRTIDYVNFDNETGNGTDISEAVRIDGPNEFTVTDNPNGPVRYVRCTGDAAGLMQAFAGSAAQAAPPAAVQPISTDYGRLCSDQDTVNSLRDPIKNAVTQVLGSGGPGDVQAGLWMLSVWANEPKYRLLNIGRGEVQNGPGDTVTVLCRTDLRLLVPMSAANGAFSRYLQFNRTAYKIRIKSAGSDSPEVYIVVEIRPVNGKWDVSTGTE